jgi:hypothetical protein
MYTRPISTARPFYQTPKDEDSSNCCKITSIVIAILLLLASAAAIACGVTFSLIALWATATALVPVALLILACSCCCCDEEKVPTRIPIRELPVVEPTIVKIESLPDPKLDDVPPKNKPPVISAELFENLDKKSLALTYGKQIIQWYHLDTSELAEVKKCEYHVIKALLRHWKEIPDNTGDIAGFVCMYLIAPFEEIQEEKQQREGLKELIDLLDESDFDFAPLFKDLFGWALSDQTVLKKLFPLLYLEDSLELADNAKKTARLRAFFSDPTTAMGMLAFNIEKLSSSQKAALTAFLISENRHNDPKWYVCMTLLK